MGQYSSALKDFDEAIALCPTCYLAYIHRGATLLMSGKGTPDMIEADYLKALTLAPGDRTSVLQWGHWLSHQQRFGEAEAQFRKAMHLFPDDLEPVIVLATIYCNTGRSGMGASLLEEFIAHSPVPASQSDRVFQLLKNCKESMRMP